MKRIFWLYWANVLILLLVGWQLILYFSANTQFAKIVEENQQTSWEITIGIVPFEFLLVVSGIVIAINYRYRKIRKLTSSIFLPSDFIEEDEREKMITAKACRTSYIAMWYSWPFLAAVMTFTPLFAKIVPYFTLIIFLMLPLVQVTAYYISIRKSI